MLLCYSGEAAGIRITIESLEADLDSERSEHRDTKLKANNDARAVKELTREVERLKIFEDLHNASESDDSGRLELVDR